MHSFLAMALIPALAVAGDWPRFRGPNGSGTPGDDKAPADFALDRNVLFKVKTPAGHSSPILVKDRLFLTGHDGDQRVVLCLDAAKGTEIWRRSLARVRTETAHPLNGPATPTPATDGSHVYAFFPEYGLVSFDWGGKERWRTPLGPFDTIQGVATSPVYAEGVVAVLIDQPGDSYLIAFDAKSGKQRWKASRPSGFLGGYSTPSVYKPAKGPSQLVVAGAIELTGYQVATGERLWWARNITNAPAALPLVANDVVYTMEPAGEAPEPFSRVGQYDKNKDGRIEVAAEVTGDGFGEQIWRKILTSVDRHHGNKDGVVEESEWRASFSGAPKAGGLQAVRLGSKGELPPSEMKWRVEKGMPYVTAPLLYRDVLYIVRNGGILTSYRPETGEILKQGRVKEALGDYYASPVAAGGRLYLVNKDGKLSVLQAGAQWEFVSGVDLGEQVIATPALGDGRIYVRTAGTLYGFGS